MLTVFRQRNFSLLWIGNFISLMGDWMLLVALPFYVFQRTGSALATGATFISSTFTNALGPLLMFGLMGAFYFLAGAVALPLLRNARIHVEQADISLEMRQKNT